MARVLVVDDDPVIRDLLTVNLEIEGHEVVQAEDGAVALAAVEAHPPDLVLLDVMMPNIDGWQVAETLKSSPSTRDVLVVLLSARAMEADVRKGAELGADRYVTKPFDPIDLMAVCDELLDGREAR